MPTYEGGELIVQTEKKNFSKKHTNNRLTCKGLDGHFELWHTLESTLCGRFDVLFSVSFDEVQRRRLVLTTHQLPFHYINQLIVFQMRVLTTSDRLWQCILVPEYE